jgi:hypothetical protein
MYERLKTVLHEAAFESLGQRHGKHEKKGYWWSSEVEELIQEKQSKYEEWLATHEQEDREQYMKISTEVKQRAVTRAKNDSWERKCQEIEYFIGGTKTKLSWKTIRGIRQENKNKLNIQMIKLNEWVRCYSEMLTENRHKYQNIQTDRLIIGKVEEITIHEIKSSLKK